MSPKTPEQNEEIRQQSMNKILEAAFVLIAKNGYESTSIAQIAKQAGISKGLLYNYFTSKEELLQTLVNNAMQHGDQIMNEIITDDPSTTLKNMFEWYFKDIVEHADQWKLMTALIFKIDKFQFVHDVATQKMKEYVGFMQSLLEQLGFKDPKNEAQLIAALFDGIGVQYLLMRDDYPIEQMKAYLIKKYCDT